jgi:hypothetical protein
MGESFGEMFGESIIPLFPPLAKGDEGGIGK